MGYTALYRKWRPLTFSDVRGQDAVVQTLQHQVASGQTGHAYLFCGTRGTGKTSVAKILARAVNCESPRDGEPCNECPSCRGILAGAAMNVVEIDAASNNGVSNVRDIVEEVQYPPADGRFRVYIIDEAHMLTPEAENALLKTLEEPPSYVIFILATTEVHKILPTVLSRCQRYDFKRISPETLQGRLSQLAEAEGISAEDKALSYIAKKADGSMRDAISLFDQCAAFFYKKTLTYDGVLEVLGDVDYEVHHRLFDAAVHGDTAGCIRLLDRMVMEGRELSQLTSDFVWYLRCLLVVKTTGSADEELLNMTASDLAALRIMANEAEEGTLMRYIRVFSELQNRMRYASDKRVLLEVAFIRLSRPEMERDIDSLADRVAQLEKRLEEGNFVSSGAPAAAPAAPAREAVVKHLPKMQMDEFDTVRGSWKTILSAMSQYSYQVAVRRARLEPVEEGVLQLVYANARDALIGGREELLSDLSAATAAVIGKSVSYRARSAVQDEAPVRYVLKEEAEKTFRGIPIGEDEEDEA
ncbi:MAG: DNA polymerase III subunit gamma/tau [Lachnospiraceae bacterium]|nr:DNA polymerase III subunit gamma/tau [Lachnospiraceae bacterium]